MEFKKAIEILDIYIKEETIENDQDFIHTLILSREALKGLRYLEEYLTESLKQNILP